LLLDACIMFINHNFAIDVCNLQKINSSCSKFIMVSDFFLTTFCCFLTKNLRMFLENCVFLVWNWLILLIFRKFFNHLILKFWGKKPLIMWYVIATQIKSCYINIHHEPQENNWLYHSKPIVVHILKHWNMRIHPSMGKI